MTISEIQGWFEPESSTSDGKKKAKINEIIQAVNSLQATVGNGNLDDLQDVTVSTPADNEVLAYDSASGEWINQTAAEAGLAEASHNHIAADVTDFDTEVSNNTDVAANTSHRNTTSGNPHNVSATEITDFDTEVSNNTDVAANTSARHTHSNKTYIDQIDQSLGTLSSPTFKSLKLSALPQATIDTDKFLCLDSGDSNKVKYRSGAEVLSDIGAAADSHNHDHGTLTGLSDDDHPQYLLANGSRSVSGDLLPDANNTRDLGSSALYWALAYIYKLIVGAGDVNAYVRIGSNARLMSKNSSWLHVRNSDDTDYLGVACKQLWVTSYNHETATPSKILVGSTTNSEVRYRTSTEIRTDIGAAKASDVSTIEAFLMFGSANSTWYNCVFIGDNTGTAGTYSIKITNKQTGSAHWAFALPLPTSRGGKSLYIKGIKICIADADGNNYMYWVRLIGVTTSHTTLYENDAIEHYTTTGVKTFTFSAINCSSYRKVGVVFGVSTNTVSAFDVSYVQVDCYYA